MLGEPQAMPFSGVCPVASGTGGQIGRREAHPLLRHALPVLRMIARQAEALVGHAAREAAAGMALGPAALTPSIQVFKVRRLSGAP